MLRAIEHLLLKEDVIAEAAGAAAIAAWLANASAATTGPIVFVVSGSNIAESILQEALTRERRSPARLSRS